MNDNELFEQARKRVQKKIKGKCVRNKDVIVDQEKEIIHYREQIKKLMNILEDKKELDKEFEITINNEEYVIKYNRDTDIVMLNTYITKLVNESEVFKVHKLNEFKIINKTRVKRNDETCKHYFK